LEFRGNAFRDLFPADWSEYDLLRLDVFSEKTAVTVGVVLEDEEIEPPVVRNIRCEPEKWVTVEIDLRAAERSRGLDLKHLVELTVSPFGGKRNSFVWIDNLRLAKRDSAVSFPRARDDSPWELSQEAVACCRRSESLLPEVLPKTVPDRSPIRIEDPIVIQGTVLDEVATAKNLDGLPIPRGHGKDYIALAPCGWVAAYDNSRLLVGFTGYGERDMFALQSVDGGTHWRGLDGSEHAQPWFPCRIPTMAPDRAMWWDNAATCSF
jgi:hypothetical protein